MRKTVQKCHKKICRSIGQCVSASGGGGLAIVSVELILVTNFLYYVQTVYAS